MLGVVGFLHVAVPIGTGDEAALQAARHFYGEVLGLPLDAGRPPIPGITGYWYNIPQGPRPPGAPKAEPRQVGPPPASLDQIHLIGRPDAAADFTGRPASGPEMAAGRPWPVAHVALAVRSLAAAKEELERLGIQYRVQTQAVGAEQVFFLDPFGTMIELQEAR